MDNRGYIIIDGSHLFASIFDIYRKFPKLKNKKLIISNFTEALIRKWSLHIGGMVRCIIYVKKTEPRVAEMLNVGDISKPGVKSHWRIKECGQRLKGIPEEELQKLPPEYRDHFARAEKGVDIQLTCDVLMLATGGKASNFVFLVNDRDYLPLFESLHNIGANIYLTELSEKLDVQESIIDMSDMYLTLDNELENIFGLLVEKEEPKEQNL